MIYCLLIDILGTGTAFPHSSLWQVQMIICCKTQMQLKKVQSFVNLFQNPDFLLSGVDPEVCILQFQLGLDNPPWSDANQNKYRHPQFYFLEYSDKCR